MTPARRRADDLTRRRAGTYAAPETGRHHHLGAAPERQPLHGEDGVTDVETSAVQLASRTADQLTALRERLAGQMAQAAAELAFEAAASLRDGLAAVDAERARRASNRGVSHSAAASKKQ